MSDPRVLVLRAAGTNCDAEAAHAFEQAGARVDLVHIGAVVERPERLRAAAVLVFPGGFTFGDDVASGAVFAVRLRTRLREALRGAVDDGALVLGICNGFQILVRAGLLPAFDGNPTPGDVTLGFNDTARFEARWVTLEGTSDRCPWVARGTVIECPVAHAEGKFVVRDDATLARLEANGQIVLRYRMPDGTPPGTWPYNPNGSVADIAGICDPTGRVLGLMPHPERNVEPWHHPLGTHDPVPPGAAGGRTLFDNAVRWAREHA